MNEAEPLISDQVDHGGDGACCVISCAIAKRYLKTRLYPKRKEIDELVKQGSALWKTLNIGFMSVDQVLELNDFSGLKTKNYHCNTTGEICDDENNTLAYDAKTVIINWIRSLSEGISIVIVTRAGYTFTICPHDSRYYVIDSHRNVLTQRKSAIDRTMRLKEYCDERSGALIQFLFPKDVADYVVNFLPSEIVDPRYNVSTNELDIDQLTLI